MKKIMNEKKLESICLRLRAALLDPDIPDYKLHEAVMLFEQLHEANLPEKATEKYITLDEMKELIEKYIQVFMRELKKMDNNG